MLTLANDRGTTLLEAIVAAGLLVTIAVGTASFILLARRLGERTEQLTMATTLAAARLDVLRAVPLRYEIDGTESAFAGLAFSPADALERNASGYWDTTDESGLVLPGPAAAGAAFVRRWAIAPALSGAAQARAIEVCVFEWPAERNPVPLACLASARTRQP